MSVERRLGLWSPPLVSGLMSLEGGRRSQFHHFEVHPGAGVPALSGPGLPCTSPRHGVTVVPGVSQARYVQAKLSVHDRSLKVATVIESLEMEMELLCLTGVEDQLQADVRPTLETLRNAGIKVRRACRLVADPGLGEWALQRRLKIRDGAEGGSGDREHREPDSDGDLKRSILPVLTARFQKTSCVSFRRWLPSAHWVP